MSGQNGLKIEQTMSRQIGWMKEAEACAGEIIALREEIHRHPELGNKEFKTSALVTERLADWGLEVKHYLDTAVVGILRGTEPGPVIALRADMDALPVREETGCAFASENEGCMHACGHDVHTAAALGAARILASRKQGLKGEIRFIFQPDEEGDGGAQRLIEAGALRGVEAVFGAHVSPDLAAGQVGIRYGKFYAASDVFYVTVHGKGAHGAEPQKGIDALGAAAEMVCRLRAIPAEFAPERCILSVGQLQSGTAVNVIADEAVFCGIIRTLGADSRKRMKERFRVTIGEVAEAYGATAEIRIRESYPGVVNTDTLSAYTEDVARQVFGSSAVERIEEPTMTTEDFGYYADACTGCFYHIGVGGEWALHNSHFLPDSGAPVRAAALHAALLWGYSEYSE